MSAAERRQSRRGLIDYASPVPMWCSDADSEKIVDANDAALHFWRYDRTQFLGMPATQLLCTEEMPKQQRLAKLNLWGETGPWKCRRGDDTILYVTVRWQRVLRSKRVCDFVFVSAAGESVAKLERIAARGSRRSDS